VTSGYVLACYGITVVSLCSYAGWVIAMYRAVLRRERQS
jgi:heme exporter protein CcmD